MRRRRVLSTSEEEGDEAGLLGHVQLQTGATEDVFHHGLRASGPLEEGEELFGLLCLLMREEGGEGEREKDTDCDNIS